MPLSKLYLELTDRCNLCCDVCYRQTWHGQSSDMQPHLYEKLRKDVQSLPTIRTLVLGGIGEPTCSPIFSDALRHFRDRELIITTNGEFDEALVPEICACANTVVLSLDGLPATHRQARGISPDHLIANMAGLQDVRRKTGSGPKILLQCVLSTDTLPDALSMVDFVADLGADGLIFSHLMPQRQQNCAKILYGPPQNASRSRLSIASSAVHLKKMGMHAMPWDEPCEKTFDEMRIRALRRGLRLTLPPLFLKTERFCSFIEEDAAFVCASGAVVPCYRLSHNGTEFVFGREKQVHTHAFGSISASSLTEIWEDESYRLFRQRVYGGRYPSCPDCELVDGCDYVSSSEADCWCTTPSCADCLWSRRLIQCP